MPDNPVSDVVQKLQGELRESRVEAARLRLETDDLRAKVGKPDPKLARLEGEVRRLREELNETRDQRDELLMGVRSALEKLERVAVDPAD
jgi:uncharacterized coiled-coil DUF342 family protein